MFAHRWPGHWQARPPPVGGLPPCAGLALALPAGATAGTPARRRRSPRPAARECAGRRRLRRQCARRSKLRPPAGARAAVAARSRGPGLAGGRHPQRGAPGRYAGRRVRWQSRAARPAPQAWPGWQGWPERRRPGRRGGRPQSPHEWGPGRPGAPAPQPARGRSNARPGLWPAPQGLGLALRRGAPAQRLAANLTRTRRRRGLGRHISPARPRRGLDGAGGGTAAAQGGQGVGPQAGGAGGTWPARRRDADGSPFPQAARPPERTKKGVPTGHSLLFWLDKGRPASRPDRWRLAPAPAWLSLFYLTVAGIAGRQYRGLAPVPRFALRIRNCVLLGGHCGQFQLLVVGHLLRRQRVCCPRSGPCPHSLPRHFWHYAGPFPVLRQDFSFLGSTFYPPVSLGLVLGRAQIQTAQGARTL